MNPIGILITATILLLALPAALYPEAAVRFRYRHASDPEPDASAVRSMRLAGIVLSLFALTWFVAVTFVA